MQNVGRISPQRTSKHPFVKKLKYLKMTIAARAHNPPVGSQFKPNEYIRCQAKQTVYKDGSERAFDFGRVFSVVEIECPLSIT